MPSGTLRLIRATGNPYGAEDSQLFLFAGNPTIHGQIYLPDLAA